MYVYRFKYLRTKNGAASVLDRYPSWTGRHQGNLQFLNLRHQVLCLWTPTNIEKVFPSLHLELLWLVLVWKLPALANSYHYCLIVVLAGWKQNSMWKNGFADEWFGRKHKFQREVSQLESVGQECKYPLPWEFWTFNACISLTVAEMKLQKNFSTPLEVETYLPNFTS